MSVKLTLLKTGETLISEMQELVADKDQLSPHAYLLHNPHVVRTKDKQFLTEVEKAEKKFGIDVVMTPWIILSSDKKIIIPVDSVITIVEPLDSLTEMYEEKCESFKLTEEEHD